MVEGGMTCVKYLIFIFNVVFLLSGIGIIVIGALVTVEIGKYNAVLHDNFTAGSILLIVVGCIITVIAFFGCCGAIRESRCMMITFAVLLGVIIVLEMAAAITCFLYKDEVNRYAHSEFTDSWVKYDPVNQMELSKLIDVMQHDLQCCGVDGVEDWDTIIPWGKQNGKPATCCIDQGPESTDCTQKPNNLFMKGCYDSMKNVFENELVIIAGVGIGVASMQLAGIILACCLACAIRDDYRVV